MQTVTGPTGSTSTIVSVGSDFEYDLGAQRANKSFSVGGVRIASLATSYVADSAAVPPLVRGVWRALEPIAAPGAGILVVLGVFGLASLGLRRHTPVWLSAPGVGLLSVALVALPYTANAATLTSGPGKYGRHAEPFVAYLCDHLGTTRAVVNQDGIVVETRDYAPFGEEIAHAGVFALEHRFTAQPQDDQAGGLYHYGARFYHPKWGRFISPDEVVQGFDSQGLNPFTYVLNAPTSATDPTGEIALNVALGVAGFVLIAAGQYGGRYFSPEARASMVAVGGVLTFASGAALLAAYAGGSIATVSIAPVIGPAVGAETWIGGLTLAARASTRLAFGAWRLTSEIPAREIIVAVEGLAIEKRVEYFRPGSEAGDDLVSVEMNDDGTGEWIYSYKSGKVIAVSESMRRRALGDEALRSGRWSQNGNGERLHGGRSADRSASRSGAHDRAGGFSNNPSLDAAILSYYTTAVNWGIYAM